MERWVAIILGLLIIVVGFVVVQNLNDAQGEITRTGSDAECLVKQGTCVDQCTADARIDAQCTDGKICCERG